MLGLINNIYVYIIYIRMRCKILPSYTRWLHFMMKPRRPSHSKISSALVQSMLNRSQRNFARVTIVTLSWREQNFIVIEGVCVELEHFKFWSNFRFDRSIVSGTDDSTEFRWQNVNAFRKIASLVAIYAYTIKLSSSYSITFNIAILYFSLFN